MATQSNPGDAPPPYPGLPGAQDKYGQAYPGYPAPQAAYPGGQAYPTGQPTYPSTVTTTQTTYPVTHGHTTVVQTQPVAATVIIRGNACPRCGVGVLEDYWSCCAIFLAIFFFPLGLLCCLLMRQVRCTHCGAII